MAFEEGIEIEDLNPTVLHSPEHRVPAQKNGQTVYVSIAQIMALAKADTLGDETITNLVSDLAAIQQVPTGLQGFFLMNTAPAGWIKANGALLSRDTYSDLFAAIGTTFGAGDGSTTFQIPDLRKDFIRGWDDVVSFGLRQSWAIENIEGEVTTRGNQSGHFTQGLGHSDGPFSIYDDLTNSSQRTTTTNTAVSNQTLRFDASDQVNTDTETRPRNLALLPCIKF